MQTTPLALAPCPAATGQVPMGTTGGWDNKLPDSIHVVRYSFFCALIAILLYGIRVGRAWWELA